MKNVGTKRIETDRLILRKIVLKDAQSLCELLNDKAVQDYLAGILKPENTELSFWRAFAMGKYQPDLLFDNADILSRIAYHPMALWKCGRRSSSNIPSGR